MSGLNKRHTRRAGLATWAVNLTVYAIVAGFLLPVFWLLSTSFKLPLDYQTFPPQWLPAHPTLHNFQVALGITPATLGGEQNILTNFRNSLVTVTGTTVISLVVGGIAAYTFVGYRFFGKRTLLLLTLVPRMLPPVVVGLPLLLGFNSLHLTDTPLALMFAYTIFNVPFVVWMLKGFLEDLPIELEEAAQLDGLSRFGAFRRILLPLVAPGIAATAIFCGIYSWNEFALALVLTDTGRSQTIPIAASGYVSEQGVLWGEMAATGVLATLPILIFAFFVQKHLVRGLTLGAVK